MFCVEEAATSVVGVVKVPEPSAALTVIEGLELMFVSVPPLTEASWLVNVFVPVVEPAVAPSEAAHDPPLRAP